MMRKAGISVIIFICSLHLSAQEYSFLNSLEELGQRTNATFSFDPDLLKNASISRKFTSIEELTDVLENSALRLEEVGANEYLLVPQKASIQLSFANLKPDEELQPFYLDVVRGEKEVLYQNFISDPKEPISFQWYPKPGDSISVVTTAYETIQISFSELLIEASAKAELKEKVTYLEEVVIQNYLTKGITLDVPNHTTSLNMKDLALIPGETDGDVLASIATLPGINTPDSRPGNLFIRGSSTDQNLQLYNHIPIYHRGHYFGSISPYNSSVISEVKIHKNGFHPRLGGRVGGAVEINSQEDLNEYDSYGIGINSLYGNAFLRTRLGSKLGVSLAARRSLPSSFTSPKLNSISDVVYAATSLTDPRQDFNLNDIDVKYEDYNFNAIWQLGEMDKIKISSLITNNETDYGFDTDSTSAKENLTFGNDGVSIHWTHSFSSRLRSNLIGYYSDYRSQYSKENLNTRRNEREGDNSKNELKDASLTYELIGERRTGDEWSLGLSFQNMEVFYRFDEDTPDRPPYLEIDKSNANIYSLFGNYQSVGFKNFYFQLGARSSYYTPSSTFYFSPRALVNYDISDHFIAKGSMGRYYQFVSQIKFLQFGNAGFDNELWRLADEDLGVLQSDQLMIGGILTKGKWVFDLEVFKKDIDNVNYASSQSLSQMTEYDGGSWDITGFDFFSKVQVSDGLSLWTSYEYTDHTISFDSLPSVDYEYKYNQPHRVKLGGLYQKGRWKLSFSFKVLSGLYGRSFDIINQLDDLVIREVTTNMRPPMGGGMGPPPMGMGGRPGSMLVDRPATLDDLPERYPAFRSLDIFITYHLPRNLNRKWAANFGLSLINVLDNENQIDQVVRGRNPKTLLERNAIGFAPNLNLTITW